MEPYIEAALKSLTPEQKERYQKLGEAYFNDIDMETSTVNNNPVDDTVAYLVTAVKSGLHPSYLDDSEKKFLKDALGEKWYEKYNFTDDDLKKINF
jgi:hypothetical protein